MPYGEGGDLRYGFTHQQLRALVYEATNLARLRLLHRRVAAALQTQTRSADVYKRQVDDNVTDRPFMRRYETRSLRHGIVSFCDLAG